MSIFPLADAKIWVQYHPVYNEAPGQFVRDHICNQQSDEYSAGIFFQ